MPRQDAGTCACCGANGLFISKDDALIVDCTEMFRRILVIACTIPTIVVTCKKRGFLGYNIHNMQYKKQFSWICMFRINCIIKRDFHGYNVENSK
jgi:hypothetical protein